MNTDAWLLHHTPSGDTSARLTLFTSEKGLVHASCKGARGLKKRSLIQAFLPLWINLNPQNDWHYVHQIEIRGAPVYLNSLSLFAGCYVNELLYRILKPGMVCPALFHQYEQSLRELSLVTERLAIEIILRQFESALLKESGYMFSFRYDVNGFKMTAEHHYRFVAGTGFIKSETGFLGETLLAISNMDWKNPSVLQTAKIIMRQAIDHCLDGRELQSRRLFKEYKNEK